MGMIDYVRGGSREKLMRGEVPPWIENCERGPYILQVNLSAPPWVDRKALYEIRDAARFLTKVTGEQYQVDHIIPLLHPLVCGLTVPWNLRIVHYKVNGAKGNTWEPDQQEMFEMTPEQRRKEVAKLSPNQRSVHDAIARGVPIIGVPSTTGWTFRREGDKHILTKAVLSLEKRGLVRVQPTKANYKIVELTA